jgi:hypothetical protein
MIIGPCKTQTHWHQLDRNYTDNRDLNPELKGPGPGRRVTVRVAGGPGDCH